jgi:hypothetical protein
MNTQILNKRIRDDAEVCANSSRKKLATADAFDSQSCSSFEISIFMMDSSIHHVVAQKGDTILRLKEKAEKTSGKPSISQTWYFEEKCLKDDVLVDTCGLSTGSEVMCVQAAGLSKRCVFSHVYNPDRGPLANNLTYSPAGKFDTNGVLYHLGTNGGESRYKNPHATGQVKASMSGVGRGSDEARFVQNQQEHAPDESGKRNYTTRVEGSWMMVDLGEGRSLEPDHYSLRHGCEMGHVYRIHHWRLEGSNDGEAWSTIKEHKRDLSMPSQPFAVAAFCLDGPADGEEEKPPGYRYFRIIQTAKAHKGTHTLFCSGIELYGNFVDCGRASTPVPGDLQLDRILTVPLLKRLLKKRGVKFTSSKATKNYLLGRLADEGGKVTAADARVVKEEEEHQKAVVRRSYLEERERGGTEGRIRKS